MQDDIWSKMPTDGDFGGTAEIAPASARQDANVVDIFEAQNLQDPETASFPHFSRDERNRILAYKALVDAGELPAPDVGKARAMAAEFNLPEAAALAIPADMARDLLARKLGQLPKLAEWAAQNPGNAAIARDSLGWSHPGAQRLEALDKGDLAQAARDIARPALDSSLGYFGDFIKNNVNSFWNGLVDLNVNLASTLQSAAELVAENYGDASEREHWLEAGRKLKAEAERMSRLQYDIRADNPVSQLWYDILSQLPQFGGVIASSLVHPAAGLGFISPQIYGNTYKFLRDKGVDPKNAASGALIDLAGQSGLELMGGLTMAGLIKNSSWRKILSTPRAIGRAAFVEGMTEFLQKGPEYLGRAWGESSLHGRDDEERWNWFRETVSDHQNLLTALKEGAYEGLIGAFMGGGLAGGLGLARRKKISAMHSEMEQVEAESARIEENRIRTTAIDNAFRHIRELMSGSVSQSTEQRREALAQIVPENARTMFINPADLTALLQDEDVATTATTLGVEPDQIRQALDQGAPLAVNAIDVLANDSEQARKAQGNLRLEADGLSASEAEYFTPETRIQEALRRLWDSGESEEKNSQYRSYQAIYAAVNQQLARARKELEAGQLAPQEIDSIMELNKAWAVTFYKSYGVLPDRLLRNRINFEFSDQDPNKSPYALSSEEETSETDRESDEEMAANFEAALAELNGEYEAARADWNQQVLETRNPAYRLNVPNPTQAAPFEAVDNFTGWQPPENRLDPAEYADFEAADNFLAPDPLTGIPGFDPELIRNRARLISPQTREMAQSASHEDILESLFEDGVLDEAEIERLAPNGEIGPEAANFIDALLAVNYNPAQMANDRAIAESLAFDPDNSPFEAVDSFLAPRPQPFRPIANADLTSSGTRGQALIDRNRALIRIFKNRHAGTVAHEVLHVWLAELQNVASDNGSIALLNLMRSLSRISAQNSQIGYDLKIAIKKALGQNKATILGKRDAMHSLAHEFKKISELEGMNERAITEKLKKRIRDLGDGYISDAEATRLENSLDEAKDKARYYREAAAICRSAARHLKGVEQARRDINTLAAHAGLAQADRDSLLMGNQQGELFRTFQETAVNAGMAWLMEGRAPTFELKRAFARFSLWLKRLYGHIRRLIGLDELHPEVAMVFDRLVADEDQLAEDGNYEQTLEREAEILEATTLDPENRRVLEQALSDARADASAAMQKKGIRALQAYRRQRLPEIIKSIEDEPFWQMVNCQQDLKLDYYQVEQSLGEIGAKRLMSAAPQLFSFNLGISAERMLDNYDLNYPDGDALLLELQTRLVTNRETVKKLAQQRLKAEMDEKRKTFGQDYFSASAQLYGEYLRKVDQLLWRRYYQIKFPDRKITDAELRKMLVISQQAINKQAREKIATTPFREIRLSVYRTMLQKALNDRKALSSGADPMTAARTVRTARLANSLMAEAHKAIEQRQKLEKFALYLARKRGKQLTPLHRETLRKILGAFDLPVMSDSPIPEYANQSMSELLRQCWPEGSVLNAPPVFPDWLTELKYRATDEHARADYKLNDLTPEDLKELTDLLRFVYHAGRDQSEINRGRRKATRDAIISQCVELLQQLPDMKKFAADSKFHKAQDTWLKFRGYYDSLRWMMQRYDGLVSYPGNSHEQGPMSTFFEREILGAEERCRSRTREIQNGLVGPLFRLRQMQKRLDKEHGKYLKDKDGKIIPLPEAIAKAYKQPGWTADRLVALALNCGNESNRMRIKAGYSDMSYEMLEPLLGSDMAALIFKTFPGAAKVDGLLTAEDWQAVQEIWDVLGSQWKDTVDAHIALYGMAPNKLRVDPISIEIAGNAVDLKGGYYHVAYDPNIDPEIAQWEEKANLLESARSLFQQPRVNKGHTQDRSSKAPGRPMLFNTSVLTAHIKDVVTFIELAEPVFELDKMITNPVLKQAYADKFGKWDHEFAREALRHMLRKEPPIQHGEILVELANITRSHLVFWGLGFNLPVAMLQLTAIFPAMHDVGIRPMAKSLAWLAANPWRGWKTMKKIWQVSPYLKSRLTNLDQDLQSGIEKISLKNGKSITIRGHEFTWRQIYELGMKPIVIADAMATTAVWLAAYNSHLAHLTGEDEAHVSTYERMSYRNRMASAATAMATGAGIAANASTAGTANNLADPVNLAANANLANPNPAGNQGIMGNSASSSRNVASNLANPNNLASDPGLAGNPGIAGNISNPAGNQQGFWNNLANDIQASAQNGNLSGFISGNIRNFINPDLDNFFDLSSPHHAEAVRYANSMVKASNPDYDRSSRSAFLTRNTAGKLVNGFASAITLFAQRNRQMNLAHEKGRINRKQWSKYNFWDYMAGAICLGLLRSLCRGDDEEQGLASLISALADMYSMKLPIFGPLLEEIALKVADVKDAPLRNSGLRLTIEQPWNFLSEFGSSTYKILSDRDAEEAGKKLALATLDALSFYLKLPATQIYRRAARGYEQYENGQGTPLSILFPRANDDRKKTYFYQERDGKLW